LTEKIYYFFGLMTTIFEEWSTNEKKNSFGATTFSIITLSLITLSILTLENFILHRITVSITRLGIMSISITTLRIEYYYAVLIVPQCH
jgi:uncharacterized membrane protein YqjE